MDRVDIKKVRLEYKDVSGGGRQIHASIGQEVPCVEFTMRGDIGQPITWTLKEPLYICSDPWIQFQPQAWRDMIDEIFTEIVNLWNEKYGKADTETSVLAMTPWGDKIHFAKRHNKRVLFECMSPGYGEFGGDNNWSQSEVTIVDKAPIERICRKCLNIQDNVTAVTLKAKPLSADFLQILIGDYEGKVSRKE